DPASTASETLFGDISGNELGVCHGVDGKDVGISEIHQHVDSGNDEHAEEKAAWDVALRLLHFTGYVGELVPTVVSPKGALNGFGDAQKKREALEMNDCAVGG